MGIVSMFCFVVFLFQARSLLPDLSGLGSLEVLSPGSLRGVVSLRSLGVLSSLGSLGSLSGLRDQSSLVLLLLTSSLLGLTGSVEVGNDTLRGLPVGGLPGLDVEDIHSVHLFKGTTLGLVDEEENDEDSGEAASGKDVTVAEVNGAGDEGGEEGDEEVPGPVGGGGDSHAGSTVAEGVHLTTDGPDDGTPGSGETDNEEAGEDNHGNTGRVGRRVGMQNLVTDRSPDHEANEHPGGTDHQAVTATVVLDNVQTRQGHTKVNGTQNDLSNEGVAQTNTLEDAGSVVEDEVGTGQLLQRLQSNTKHSTVEHARAGEDLVPGSLSDRLLLIQLLLHIGHLLSDNTVVGGNTVELSHNFAGLLDTAVTVGETRGLGQEEGTNTQNQGPGKTDTHGDTPRGTGVDVDGTVVDDIGDEDTESDEQLESTDHGTTDLTGSRLGLVHGDNTGQGTNTKTHDPTAKGNLVPLILSGDLHDDSDDVDDSPEGD